MRSPAFPLSVLAVLSMVLTSESLTAAGFALHEHSARTLGTAYAGAGVNAGDEAAGLFWNPAGLVHAPARQVQLGAVFVTTSSRFTNQGSSQTFASPVGPTARPSTGPSDDGGTSDVIPNLYLAADLSDRVKLGLGIYAPFGLSTDYDPDWVGRYHATESSITTVHVNPVVSYQLTDRLTLGAGVSAAYLRAELSQAVLAPDPTGAGQLPDGRAALEADDWSHGFNLGLLYTHDADSRAGMAYRSAVRHELAGHRTLRGLGAYSGRTDASAALTLPESLILSGWRRLDSRWAIMADAMWTRWSRLKELRVRFGDRSPDDVTRFDWNDSWRFSVGSEFRLDSRWWLRAGLAFDQTPIPSAERRTPRLPGADRYWLAVGATYRPTNAISVDFGYAYVQLGSAQINNTIDLAAALQPGAFTDTLRGRFETDSHLIGIELNMAL